MLSLDWLEEMRKICFDREFVVLRIFTYVKNTWICNCLTFMGTLQFKPFHRICLWSIINEWRICSWSITNVSRIWLNDQ